LIQRKLQLAKIKSEVDESIQNVVAESQIALRRVTSAQETLVAALQAIEAARADLDQNLRRWESFALIEGDLADGQSPTTILDQLLDSQERLSATELVYAQAELELKISEVALQRSMGTLLIQQNVSFGKSFECQTPALEIDKGESNQSSERMIPVGVADPAFPVGYPSESFFPRSIGANSANDMRSETLPGVSRTGTENSGAMAVESTASANDRENPPKAKFQGGQAFGTGYPLSSGK
jgi:hypothetical protein